MNRKKRNPEKIIMNVLVACLAALLAIGFSACGHRQPSESDVVSALAYDRTGSEYCVYALENGVYVPFIVITDDYGGNTLLLRKDVEEENRRINDYCAYYGTSEIDAYLNDEYVKKLTELEPYIVTSEVEITSYDALLYNSFETEMIDRKAFLLSLEEVGLYVRYDFSEGKKLAYFHDAESRWVYLNGRRWSWWLRTPRALGYSGTMVIGPDNKLSMTNAYDENGIRPAFCVDGGMKVKLETGIDEGQSVYVFSFEE